MKIVEIISEDLASTMNDIAITPKDAIKGLAKGANAFVSGATDGKVDIGNWKKFIKTPPGTTRSVAANLPPQEQLDQVLIAIYGRDKATGQLKQEWVDAINSGDRGTVKRLGQKEEYRDWRRKEALDDDGIGLKQSHTTVIDNLITMAASGEFTFLAEPKDKKEPEDEKL